MKFLITGGAGFIGSNIASELLKKGYSVRILDNFSSGKRENLKGMEKDIELVEGDIRSYHIVQDSLKDIDIVLHQAALPSVPRSIKDPITTNDVNINGTLNILEAAVDMKVKRVVYASSSSVYGDEPTLPKKENLIGNCLSPYAATKKTNELYAQVFADVYGIKLMGFRYFNIFGPRQDPDGAYAAVIPLFVKHIIKRLPVFINGDGAQTRDFTFVENAVQVNIKGMLTNNADALKKVYNVAVGESFSVNYLYRACADYLESDFAATYREPRAGDIRNSLADISLAKKLLEYQPVKKFEEGLEETIEFFKQRYINE